MLTSEVTSYTGPEIPRYDDIDDRISHLDLPPEKIEIAYRIAQIALGTTALVDDLGNIERIPRTSNGNRETVAQHSFWLGIATDLIADELKDQGVSIDRGDSYRQTATHDLGETRTGDANTFNLSEDALRAKKQREHQAKIEIAPKLPESLSRAFLNHEDKRNWLATFEGLIDKLGPIGLNIVGKQMRVLTEDLKVFGLEELRETHNKLNKRFAEIAGDDEILRTIVAAHMIEARHLEQIVQDNPDMFSAVSLEQNPAEIERKFLIDLNQLPDDIDLNDETIERLHIRQAYTKLKDDGSETRVRSIDDKVFQQTKKTEGTIKRGEETNIPDISLASFNAIIENDAIGYVIDKTRYKIPLGKGKILELDIYNDRLKGLVTGEVEFQGRDALEEATAWVPPTWFGDDVTTIREFKNRELSTVRSFDDLKLDKD